MKTEFVASMPVALDPCYLGAPVFSAIGLGPALAFGFGQGAAAQQNAVTAIDIALEPDATMVQHAMAANARLLKSFPKGFALDETHHPHVTMLQQFVRTDDLDKVCGAIRDVHVLGDWRVSLSAWQLWHSPEGTQGVNVDALRRYTFCWSPSHHAGRQQWNTAIAASALLVGPMVFTDAYGQQPVPGLTGTE